MTIVFSPKQISTINFLHGSYEHLPVGTVLTPRLDYEARWGDTIFYQILERYRPLNLLPHKSAVFMCDNDEDIDLAGGGTDWIFTLEPLDQVQKHDMNWSSEISLAFDQNATEETYREIAANYWQGKPHYNESVWEYLVSSAKIIAVEAY